jgi:organic hydroperoxide reductase OsmC/OhrA
MTRGDKNIHKAVITWNEERKMFLCSIGDKSIEIAASQECKKHEGDFTPEELFVDAIEGYVKDAFMDAAKRNDLEVIQYTSEGQGIVDTIEGKLMFTEIKIRPRIIVSTNKQIGKAKEIMETVGKDCFITDFIAADISIEPEIGIGSRNDEF